MTIEEILGNTTDLTDDIEFELKGHKIKLGDLRGLTKAQQKKLSEQMEAAKADRQSAADLATKSATLFAELTKKQEELAAAATATTRTTTDGADDFDSAEYWSPVRKRLSPIEKQLKDALDKVGTLEGQLKNAATIFATERWKGQYAANRDRLKKSDEYKDWDMNKVLGYATERKIVDEYGFPSIERAVADMTKANEIEEIRKSAREEGFKEGVTRGRLATTGRPTSAAGGVERASKTIDPAKNFEDLGDVVTQDPELAKMLADLGTLSAEDIVQ
jgi:hypothetical protein